jgi:hypothetical protein
MRECAQVVCLRPQRDKTSDLEAFKAFGVEMMVNPDVTVAHNNDTIYCRPVFHQEETDTPTATNSIFKTISKPPFSFQVTIEAALYDRIAKISVANNSTAVAVERTLYHHGGLKSSS